MPEISPELNQGFQRAFDLAKSRRHEDVALEHLLLALASAPGTEAYDVLTADGLGHDAVSAALDEEMRQSLAVAGVDRRRRRGVRRGPPRRLRRSHSQRH